MTFLLSAGAALWNQVQLWTGRANNAWGASRQWNVGASFESDSSMWAGRANNAWGASRVWNSGTSFETDVATWTSRANQAWGASRVWNSGQSFEIDRNAAYDSGTWGSGNLWSTDAHNDPNVWTNRYNTGYTDGVNSIPGISTLDSGAFSYTSDTSGGYVTVANLTANRTGYWLVYYRGTAGNFASGGNANWKIMQGGSQLDFGSGGNGWSADVGLFWLGVLGNGAAVSLQVKLDNQGFSGHVDGHLYATFIPTPTYPR